MTKRFALTDTAVKSAKPRDRAYKLIDGEGLFLLVNTSGSKLWRLRFLMGGKERLASLGSYPATSLAAARDRDKATREQIEAGVDPVAEKRKIDAEEAENARTFGDVADVFLEKMRAEAKADATIKKTEWLLDLVRPDLGKKPIRSIDVPMILAALKKIEARGRRETALRARGTIGRVFRLAMANSWASADPTPALHGALLQPLTKHRAAVTDRTAFAGLLRSIDAYQGQPEVITCLNLLALLVPRPGELRMAEWSEFDLEAAVWTIPAARTKMRREFRTPLPRQAVALLLALRDVARASRLVFPSTRSADRCISENTTNAALRRMGYGQDEATSHGFRATFATIANESGLWHPDAIERHLAHVEQNEVRRAYTRGEHWDERVRLVQWWADLIDQLRDGKANVVAFVPKGA